MRRYYMVVLIFDKNILTILWSKSINIAVHVETYSYLIMNTFNYVGGKNCFRIPADLCHSIDDSEKELKKKNCRQKSSSIETYEGADDSTISYSFSTKQVKEDESGWQVAQKTDGTGQVRHHHHASSSQRGSTLHEESGRVRRKMKMTMNLTRITNLHFQFLDSLHWHLPVRYVVLSSGVFSTTRSKDRHSML